MSRFATLDRDKSMSAILKVVGVGGGGCNAIESMIKRGLIGVEYVAVNTDAQVLNGSSANHKIQVGTTITRGLGAGADPNVGKKSLEEDRERLAEVLSGSDMVLQLVWEEEQEQAVRRLLLQLLKVWAHWLLV